MWTNFALVDVFLQKIAFTSDILFRAILDGYVKETNQKKNHCLLNMKQSW